MDKKNPVGWFEIPTIDLDRAISFYEGVFGVTLDRNSIGPVQMAWFPMLQDAPQATGTLIKHESYTPSKDGVLIYFTAPDGDIPGTLKRVKKEGGTVLQEKNSIGDHGFVAQFVDTEGNRIALHSIK